MTPEKQHPRHLHPYVPLEDPEEEAAQAESIAEFSGIYVDRNPSGWGEVIPGPWGAEDPPDLAA